MSWSSPSTIILRTKTSLPLCLLIKSASNNASCRGKFTSSSSLNHAFKTVSCSIESTADVALDSPRLLSEGPDSDVSAGSHPGKKQRAHNRISQRIMLGRLPKAIDYGKKRPNPKLFLGSRFLKTLLQYHHSHGGPILAMVVIKRVVPPITVLFL